MEMVLNAYQQRSDDPYIIDSIGWAYYLTEDYLMSEKYLKNRPLYDCIARDWTLEFAMN